MVERLVGEHILHLGVQFVGKAVDFLRVAGVGGGTFAVGEIPAQHIVNHRGANEKYFESTTGAAYFIMPDGSFFQLVNNSLASSIQIARLEAA